LRPRKIDKVSRQRMNPQSWARFDAVDSEVPLATPAGQISEDDRSSMYEEWKTEEAQRVADTATPSNFKEISSTPFHDGRALRFLLCPSEAEA